MNESFPTNASPGSSKDREDSESVSEEITDELREEFSKYCVEILPDQASGADSFLDAVDVEPNNKEFIYFMRMLFMLGRHEKMPEVYKQKFRFLELLNGTREAVDPVTGKNSDAYINLVASSIDLLSELLTVEALYALQEHFENIFLPRPNSFND